MQCIKTRIEWLKRIISALTGKCIFGDAVTFINKDCRVLFGDIFIVPFLGPALGWTAMCSPGWGNLVAIDWPGMICPWAGNLTAKFWKMSNPHPMPCLPPPPAGLTLIDRCITFFSCYRWFFQGRWWTVPTGRGGEVKLQRFVLKLKAKGPLGT